MIRRCATSIEAEGIQRPHANTSQEINFFLLFFFLFNSIVLLSPSFPPLTHSGHSEPKRVTARGRSGSKDTDGGERADLRTLGVEQKPGPVSRSLGNARAKLGG